jgi:hypothetical protein
MQAIFAMGTASAGSERITDFLMSMISILNWKSFKEVFSIPGVLNPCTPLLLPLMKGKREEEELVGEMAFLLHIVQYW